MMDDKKYGYPFGGSPYPPRNAGGYPPQYPQQPRQQYYPQQPGQGMMQNGYQPQQMQQPGYAPQQPDGTMQRQRNRRTEWNQ